MTRWSWHGAVALTLSMTLGVCLVVLVVRWAVSARPLGDVAGSALATTLGALAGAVCSYLGRVNATPSTTRRRRVDIPIQWKDHPMTSTNQPPDPDNLPDPADTDSTDAPTPDHPVREHVEEHVEEHREEHRTNTAADDQDDEVDDSGNQSGRSSGSASQ